LQNKYYEEIKTIYIDPPYNTGRDFVYKDNFTQDKAEYDEESGNVDDEGGRLISNPDSNGRYHSDWLTMMYPRLKLARNLLSDDGVILLSIGDEEYANLKSISNEAFGERNYYGTINWTATTKSMNAGTSKYKIQKTEEYILVYGRVSMQEHAPFNLVSKGKKKYPESSSDARSYRFEEIQQRKNIGIKRSEKMVFKILDVNPKDGYRWTIGEDTARLLESNSDVVIKNGKPIRKIYSTDEESESYHPFWANFSNTCGTSESGKLLLFNLLKKEHGFETVKPVDLIEKMIFHFCNKDDFILDFFSGSATTAHAIMQLNAKDQGSRKFIMVQIPETVDKESEAFKAGYKTIPEIGKERIRRAGEKIKTDNADKEGIDDLDVGFRVLKVDSSNMKDVYFSPDNTSQDDMFDRASNIKDDRSDEDLLFMVLLDWGIDLSVKIERREVAGKTVYFADDNFLAACFSENLDEDFVKALVAENPLKVVLRDNGFDNDSVKINVEQIFKQAEIEVKVI